MPRSWQILPFDIILQVGVALIVLAAADYGYKFWQTNQDLKMTKEEVKDETKNTEGNPQVKAQQRRRRHRHDQTQDACGSA